MMENCICYQEELEIPSDIRSLTDFRRWALSDEFPNRGRIDYLNGRIEVQWSPEDLFLHGGLKVELARVLSQQIGQVRFSSPAADLSAEPDMLFISYDAQRGGRITTVRGPSGGGCVRAELEGAPDLIVEIVGYTSATKDMLRLPPLYWKAGVTEFWLPNAQEDELVFRIFRRGANCFELTSRDGDGFQYSPMFDQAYRLERYRGADGYWAFDLRERRASLPTRLAEIDY